MRLVLLSALLAMTGVAAASPLPSKDDMQGRTFIMPEEEGYGLADCLTGGVASCGKVVADAWCEAHGYASAMTFGRVENAEVTGTTASVRRRAAAKAPIVITCQD